MYEINLCPGKNRACCPHLQIDDGSYKIVDKEEGKQIELWSGDI